MLNRIKDRTRARFHFNLSEVGAQNTWQRLMLGFAMVASERTVAEKSLARVVGFVESMGLASVIGDEREVMAYGDVIGAGPRDEAFGVEQLERGALREATSDEPESDDWIPEAWKANLDAGHGGGEGER